MLKRPRIVRLFVDPPLAVARVGNSPNPVPAFMWDRNDFTPGGTGKTTITALDGEPLIFKDGPDQIRPVWPYFEARALVAENGRERERPLSARLIEACGYSLEDVTWTVHVANLKAFQRTQRESDRIEAIVSAPAGKAAVHELRGKSPGGRKAGSREEMLVPRGRSIPLGRVQVIAPPNATSALRIRFHSPTGEVYGPTNFDALQTGWNIPEQNLFLNPSSAWCTWNPQAGERREYPPGIHAPIDGNKNMGLIDDMSDGFVECRIANTDLSAKARIVVGPPHYSPDRRHFVSVADGLKDRVSRLEVRREAYYEQPSERYKERSQADDEVEDLMGRIFETLGSCNVDALLDRVNKADSRYFAFSADLAPAENECPGFVPPLAAGDDHLPLTERARRQHRRFISLAVFRQYIQERAAVLGDRVRQPGTGLVWDDRMPALMRGSDGRPLTLTRRQYEMLMLWASRVCRKAGP